MTAPGAEGQLPWREIVRWSVLGLLGLLLLVGVDVARHGGSNPVSLIQPGLDGPSTALVAADFPELEQPAGSGLDGQQYYAIARDPLHLDQTSRYLDNPRYRLQRPLLPWAAWALHPTGGGTGLVGSLVLVSLIGIVVLAVASGALSMRLGGPAWVAAVVPILPGTYWCLRVTVSDAMALGLALLAVYLATRNQLVAAVCVGVLAVLAKEPIILVLLGWSLFRRTRRDAWVTIVPAAAIVAWMGWLHLVLPPDPSTAQDIGLPGVGLVQAWTDIWSEGREWVGMACTLTGFAIGIAALAVRRLRHPLGWAILLQLGFLSVMGLNPLGANFGGTRMALPLMALSIIALVTPNAAEALSGGDADVEVEATLDEPVLSPA